jgi:hypothetical protein
MSLTQHDKSIASLARALKLLTRKKECSDIERYDNLKKALDAARKVSFDELLIELEREGDEFKRKIDVAVDQRREQLLSAARDAVVPFKRLTDYDRVGVFKVDYKGKKVQLSVGSEALVTLEEADGAQLFEAIQKEAQALEEERFSREGYFDVLKVALAIAKSKGQQKDGSVPIKTLYPYVALARQTQSDQFLKTPDTKRFQDYSTAQFVFDLARFGREGWSVGNETLSTQTPNMATISAGKSMTPPVLDSIEGSGKPFATLMIKKKET